MEMGGEWAGSIGALQHGVTACAQSRPACVVLRAIGFTHVHGVVGARSQPRPCPQMCVWVKGRGKVLLPPRMLRFCETVLDPARLYARKGVREHVDGCTRARAGL
eukprot:5231390-Pleurochrysis_carterae.AAC.6